MGRFYFSQLSGAQGTAPSSHSYQKAEQNSDPGSVPLPPQASNSRPLSKASPLHEAGLILLNLGVRELCSPLKEHWEAPPGVLQEVAPLLPSPRSVHHGDLSLTTEHKGASLPRRSAGPLKPKCAVPRTRCLFLHDPLKGCHSPLRLFPKMFKEINRKYCKPGSIHISWSLSHIHTDAHTHTHSYTNMCTHPHACTYTCTHMQTCTVHTHIPACTEAHRNMYAHVCAIYKCTRTRGHMRAHVCAHICRHTTFPTEKVTSAHKPPLAIPGLFSVST